MVISESNSELPLQVDREYRVQKALFSAGFPVPQPILHCTDVDLIGTEFYLMEHVNVSSCVFPVPWTLFNLHYSSLIRVLIHLPLFAFKQFCYLFILQSF